MFIKHFNWQFINNFFATVNILNVLSFSELNIGVMNSINVFDELMSTLLENPL